jgi:hypothetical protein
MAPQTSAQQFALGRDEVHCIIKKIKNKKIIKIKQSCVQQMPLGEMR